MHLLLIAVYNEWKSLNKLLININKNQKNNKISNILIVNDSSSEKPILKIKFIHIF